jgi:hypothetical protein
MMRQTLSWFTPPPVSKSLTTDSRRFPPPWSVDDPDTKLRQDYYIVRDANGYPVAYVYFEDEPGRRSAAHLMARDEARRIAVNIAKLPKLLGR